jgi:glycine cleavage system H lipoate-binding protein
LPSSAGRQSQLQCLTSFIIDERVAVDAGSIGFAFSPGQIGTVRHIIVTHSHSDHTASLPIYIAEAFPMLDTPIVIYGSIEVNTALKDKPETVNSDPHGSGMIVLKLAEATFADTLLDASQYADLVK